MFVAETRRILDVNIIGVLLGMKAMMPEMKKNGAGSIVNTSTVAGLVAGSSGGSLAYVAAKSALGVAKEGIWEHAVSGLVHTPIMDSFSKEITEATLAEVPVGFAAEPIDIAYGVLFLSSDEARFVTGTDILLDGGFTAP